MKKKVKAPRGPNAREPKDLKDLDKHVNAANRMGLKFEVRKTFDDYKKYMHHRQLVYGSSPKIEGIIWFYKNKPGICDMSDFKESMRIKKNMFLSGMGRWNQLMQRAVGVTGRTSVFRYQSDECTINEHVDIEGMGDFKTPSTSGVKHCRFAFYVCINGQWSVQHIPPVWFRVFDIKNKMKPIINIGFKPRGKLPDQPLPKDYVSVTDVEGDEETDIPPPPDTTTLTSQTTKDI